MTVVALVVLMEGALLQGPVILQPPETVKPPLVVPAGTVIPVTLATRISTKNARDGDGIYAQTAFPITVNNEVVIPAGSFVRGRIAQVEQPGRISGRAEMTFSFHTLVLPSGITLEMFASLGGTGGAVERKGEATVVADKGEDGEEIVTESAKGAGTGAAVGAIGTRSAGGAAKGAVIGAGVGAAGAALGALIRRGDDLVLEPGTMIELVLDYPLEP